MPRFALRLEYDGAAFNGSQRQRNAPSVQQTLEEAIARIGGAAVRSTFAGRTDAGVHATGQVASFSTSATHTPQTWQRALNATLPESVAVTAIAEVGATFDPRRHAVSRRYRYRIWNATGRAPLERRCSWWVSVPLDVPAMADAVGALIGEHDLASFGGLPGPGRSTVRRIDAVSVVRTGPLVEIEITGSAFLPHQVRRTVGALVELGRGRLKPQQFERWLAQPVPGAAGPTAPAHGLCLMQVMFRDPPFGDDCEGRGTT